MEHQKLNVVVKVCASTTSVSACQVIQERIARRKQSAQKTAVIMAFARTVDVTVVRPSVDLIVIRRMHVQMDVQKEEFV